MAGTLEINTGGDGSTFQEENMREQTIQRKTSKYNANMH